jgi:hypothetical protein
LLLTRAGRGVHRGECIDHNVSPYRPH